jgi:hypothetical protein
MADLSSDSIPIFRPVKQRKVLRTRRKEDEGEEEELSLSAAVPV